MRVLAVLYGVGLLSVAACRKHEQQSAPATATSTSSAPASTTRADTSPVPPAKDVKEVIPVAAGEISRCEAGGAVGKSGVVETPKASFASGEPIFLSLWLDEAPKELQVSAHVLDAKGYEVAVARKEAEGLKVTTLKLETKLAPGKYTLEGVWGGNRGCEKALVIVP